MTRLKYMIAVAASAIAGLALAGPAAAANPVATPFPLDTSTPDHLTPKTNGDFWTVNSDTVSTLSTAGVVTELGEFGESRKMIRGTIEGPDGNLWVTIANDRSDGPSRIGRMTPAGEVSKYRKGISKGASPDDIVAGPDGALWFAEETHPSLGRVTTDGEITELPVSGVAGTDGVAVGADGRIWFMSSDGTKVGAMSTGGAVETFATGLSKKFEPLSMALGPDGRVWFSAASKRKSIVLAVDTAGNATTVTTDLLPRTGVSSLVAGPDGNVWGLNSTLGTLVRITPAGEVTQLTAGVPFDRYYYADGLAVGSDANFWFASEEKFWRYDPTGVDETAKPPVAITSAPEPTIVTKSGRETVDFDIEAPDGVELYCSLESASYLDLRPCGEHFSKNVRVYSGKRRFEFYVAAVSADGVVGTTPARYAFTLKLRKKKHGHK